MNLKADIFKELPKLELHAHLNGSLSADTLQQLIELQKCNLGHGEVAYNVWEAVIQHGNTRTLEECFQVFGIAHSLTSNPAAVYTATQNVIKEYADDGVIYLELRSTPRAVPGVMSRTEYVNTIIDAINNSQRNDILVKLLISIDRRQGKEVAEEILDLALSQHRQYPHIIAGIDLSGDPSKGVITDYLPILQQARDAGLKISIHCAEIPNPQEVEKILTFEPDRLGHCTCVHPLYGGTEQLWQRLLDSNIPVELCMTSNVKCGTVENYEKHHILHFISAKHPVALATDDKGVFATSLSEEYALASHHHHLTKEQLWQLSLSTIDYTFTSQDEKELLKQRFFKVKDRFFKNK